MEDFFKIRLFFLVRFPRMAGEPFSFKRVGRNILTSPTPRLISRFLHGFYMVMCRSKISNSQSANLIGQSHRDVAQLGSALRSGRRGRRFKSCHPDAFLSLNERPYTLKMWMNLIE
jgi:hypothetical protein